MRLLLLGKGPLNACFLWEKPNQSNSIGVLRNIQQMLKSFEDPKKQVQNTCWDSNLEQDMSVHPYLTEVVLVSWKWQKEAYFITVFFQFYINLSEGVPPA